jgi:PKHD-type hydroxylase
MSYSYNYWFWNKLFDFKKVEKINNFIDKNFEKYEEKTAHAKDNEGNSKKDAIVKIIKYKKIKNLIHDFKEDFISSARYNFGYNVFDITDHQECNLNIYSSLNSGSYDWHIDFSQSDLYDVKLTVLINLSVKKYEGGKFCLWSNNENEVKELNVPGNAIMFKSNIHHKVYPVIKGERRTLAIFLKGPKFR